MRFDIVTIFPDIFFGPFSESIVKRACEKKLIEINTVDLRKFTGDRRGTVDDKPYGGGPGMLMKPEPFFEAVDELRTEDSLVVLPSPQGERFDHALALDLSREKHIIFLCGHYEGVDERIRTGLADREISIGDYVLTSGNLPVMVVIDAVARLLDGVLGCRESGFSESFSENRLEYPQYTRPEEYRGMKVPEVLLSGNHEKIRKWREKKADERTRKRRPDLFDGDENGGYDR